VELVEVASGFRYQVQADVHAWVARLWSERQTKYTRATLETLVLIAYRQPITRGEIEQIRGVAVNSNIIKALEEREWIRVVGHRDMPGKPELLGTTRAFLDYFGLQRLDQLPPLSELKDFGELEPELQFESGPIVVDNISDLGRTDMTEADTGADPEETALATAGAYNQDTSAQVTVADEATAELKPEHDTLREERADSDPAIADADTDADTQSQSSIEPDNEFQPALADEGDSTGARHE